jgi:hypothetical protein
LTGGRVELEKHERNCTGVYIQYDGWVGQQR